MKNLPPDVYEKPAKKPSKKEEFDWENVKRPFSDKAIKGLPVPSKTMKLFDGQGLFIELSKAGGKLWRFKYRFDGKEKLLSFGAYPDVGLADAREKRDAARKLITNGKDPSAEAKAEKQAKVESTATTFEGLAREWLVLTAEKRTPENNVRALRRLERDIFPWLGAKPIRTITTPDLLTVLERAQGRGVGETVHRALWTCGGIFRYAIQRGLLNQDPTPALRGALKPMKTKHFAAVTEVKEVGPLLRAIDAYQGSLVVKSALRLAPLVFVRPVELRTAEWGHIDLEAAEWRYVVGKTKTPHVVPLSKQAVAILNDLYPLTGSGKYAFPSARKDGRPLSDAGLIVALRAIGIDQETMTIHGFRAMARTILDEVLKYRVDYIEHQLAHRVKDANGRAYNRTSHLDERKKMMQHWADYLDELKAGAKVIKLKA
jgi:integrase